MLRTKGRSGSRTIAGAATRSFAWAHVSAGRASHGWSRDADMKIESPNELSEIQRLRRGIHDLTSVMALGARWTGGGTSLIASTLLEVLVQILTLDFTYLRLSESTETAPREWARFGDGSPEAAPPDALGVALHPFLAGHESTAGHRFANPMGEGTVWVAVVPLGLSDRAGQLAACSKRPDFPTEMERLVLRVAANQATIALQEAKHLRRLRRTAEELDRRVAERTQELAAASEALGREVLEREKGERALAETEDRLRYMADSVPEVIWIAELEPEERIVYTSPSFEEVWGFPLEDLYRNPRLWAEAIHPEDRDRVLRAYSDWIAGAEASYQDVEFRVVRPDGTRRWVHEHGVLSFDEQGKPIRVSGISTDITERKEAQQELERAFAKIQALKDRLQWENIALREEVEETSMFEEIVGVSAPLQAVLAQVSRVAPTDSTVLITGETGTGKELMARAIHKRSRRSDHALVSVNCAATPPSLIASELFGHEKGAFTGALQRRQGRFELADGGTIFLDEVSELPEETQIALLRVLQEREFERVGGSGPIRTDVRVIAASNRNLDEAVARGEFRADLFYRLNVFPLEMPALRERREDVPLLVEYFTHRYARRMGKKIRLIDKSSLELLRSYDWPGNVRELQNVVERAVILCQGGALEINETWLRRSTSPEVQPAIRIRRQGADREIIERALIDSGGRVSGPRGAAKRLGIPRSTLESRIRSLRISKHRFKEG